MLNSYLPQNNRRSTPRKACTDPVDRADLALDSIVPSESNLPYDIKDVIHKVVDEGDFFEVHEHWARNLVVGFARLDGRPVGIVANQPAFLAGCLDINSSVKGARFVPVLRCVQYPFDAFEDVTRISSRYRSGIRRHHSAWRWCSMLLLRLRFEDYRHYPESLWRSLLRDGVEAYSYRR